MNPTTAAASTALNATNSSSTARSPVLWIGGRTENNISAVNATRASWSVSDTNTDRIEQGRVVSIRNEENCRKLQRSKGNTKSV